MAHRNVEFPQRPAKRRTVLKSPFVAMLAQASFTGEWDPE